MGIWVSVIWGSGLGAAAFRAPAGARTLLVIWATVIPCGRTVIPCGRTVIPCGICGGSIPGACRRPDAAGDLGSRDTLRQNRDTPRQNRDTSLHHDEVFSTPRKPQTSTDEVYESRRPRPTTGTRRSSSRNCKVLRPGQSGVHALPREPSPATASL